jgi:hypothetical protein
MTTKEKAIKQLERISSHLASIGEREDYTDVAIQALEQEPRWISCNKKMPKENEYVDGVCKCYLIQDEYGDMHVAHRTNTGWRLLDSLSVLYDNVVAWRPLPEIYKAESDETPTLMSEKQYCNHDCDALYEAYAKGKEKMNRYYSILRPVSLGTFPGRIHVTKIHNFEYRTRVEEIQYVAWGYFETSDKLTEQECYEYDLVEGVNHENMG